MPICSSTEGSEYNSQHRVCYPICPAVSLYDSKSYAGERGDVVGSIPEWLRHKIDKENAKLEEEKWVTSYILFPSSLSHCSLSLEPTTPLMWRFSLSQNIQLIHHTAFCSLILTLAHLLFNSMHFLFNPSLLPLSSGRAAYDNAVNTIELTIHLSCYYTFNNGALHINEVQLPLS